MASSTTTKAGSSGQRGVPRNADPGMDDAQLKRLLGVDATGGRDARFCGPPALRSPAWGHAKHRWRRSRQGGIRS